MARYVILNLAVCAALGLYMRWRPIGLRRRFLTITLAVLIVLTAVFDSLIIWANIVAYDPDHYLQIFIGKAPIEDFAYAIVAAVFMPYLWERSGKRANKN